MSDIPQLTRSSTLGQIIDTVNAVIQHKDDENDVISSMIESSIGAKAVFQSSNHVFVSGEVFTVKTSGLYRITIDGQGTTRYMIENALTGLASDYVHVKNEYQSPEIFMSKGDKIVFYASSDANTKLTITVHLLDNFFSLMREAITTCRRLSEDVLRLQEEVAKLRK